MVLVFAESQNGKFKKIALEAVAYGYRVAQQMNVSCVALTLGIVEEGETLGTYGAEKIYNIPDKVLNHFDSQVYTQVIADVAEQVGANLIVLSDSYTGKSLLGRLAIRLNAGAVSGVNALPNTDGGFSVRKGVFSGKAYGEYEIKSTFKVVSIVRNSIQPEVVGEPKDVSILDAIAVKTPKIKVKEVKRLEGSVPLPEAELVVSGGRGMKGPENWSIIERLADTIGAATACSRPVADSGWRPHHEHVGQTGVSIRPNLYVAIGISGAIQHLAGVNSSKVIVVINKDPEAPFFNAADYGVCADLFEVVPKLTAAFEKFNGQ